MTQSQTACAVVRSPALGLCRPFAHTHAHLHPMRLGCAAWRPAAFSGVQQRAMVFPAQKGATHSVRAGGGAQCIRSQMGLRKGWGTWQDSLPGKPHSQQRFWGDRPASTAEIFTGCWGPPGMATATKTPPYSRSTVLQMPPPPGLEQP